MQGDAFLVELLFLDLWMTTMFWSKQNCVNEDLVIFRKANNQAITVTTIERPIVLECQN